MRREDVAMLGASILSRGDETGLDLIAVYNKRDSRDDKDKRDRP